MKPEKLLSFVDQGVSTVVSMTFLSFQQSMRYRAAVTQAAARELSSISGRNCDVSHYCRIMCRCEFPLPPRPVFVLG